MSAVEFPVAERKTNIVKISEKINLSYILQLRIVQLICDVEKKFKK